MSKRPPIPVTILNQGAVESDHTVVEPGSAPARKPRRGSVTSPRRVEIRTLVDSQSVVAEGGMGVVYRAFDHGLERHVAMKVIRPDASEYARQCFAQEARLMGLLDHPGIVAVHGMDRSGSTPRFFTMKLVEGRTLTQIVDEHDAPPRGQELAGLLRKMLRVCETVAFAHDRGVIHRDLKPDNVMLGRFGECYVMDWGVALQRGGPRPPGPAAVIGTPAYMAPEQALGRIEDIDERTDVYGLGTILYFILTGHAPHRGESPETLFASAMEGTFVPPELASPEIPPPARLSDIVTKALAPAREDRFQSIAELHGALAQFLFAGEWFARRRFRAGAEIMREGEAGDSAFIIERGECEIAQLRGGERRVIRRCGEGEVLGELAVIVGGERTASVTAATDVTLLEISREALARELPEGSWMRRLLGTLAGRFLDFERASQSQDGEK